MRLVLLGADGQVGWELRRALAPLGELWALGRDASEDLCGDLEQPDALRRTLRRLEPQVIVNAAAYTDVDGAETESERARRINAEGPGLLAAEAERLGAWLVHYSTDYVFDGSGRRRRHEDDAAAPLNVYGRTKWDGEQAVRRSGCSYLIFRTQWIYAARGRNFLRTILRAAAEREVLDVVDDQTGAPTGAELVADVTAHALVAARTRAGLEGTYHLAARGETSWHAYARFVVAEARRSGWPLRVTEEAVRPVSSETRPSPAPRPRNSRLDVERLERTFGLRLPEWQSGVARALAELTGR